MIHNIDRHADTLRRNVTHDACNLAGAGSNRTQTCTVVRDKLTQQLAALAQQHGSLTAVTVQHISSLCRIVDARGASNFQLWTVLADHAHAATEQATRREARDRNALLLSN